MSGVAGDATRHMASVGPVMYLVPTGYGKGLLPASVGLQGGSGQRATFNYGSGVLCIAHRLLLSLFARAALSSDHHLNLRFSDILVTSPPDILKHSS